MRIAIFFLDLKKKNDERLNEQIREEIRTSCFVLVLFFTSSSSSSLSTKMSHFYGFFFDADKVDVRRRKKIIIT